MRITDEDQIKYITNNHSELQDGLFTIVAQGQHMIEMHRVANLHEHWVITEYMLREDMTGDDMFFNPSFVRDCTLSEYFAENAVVVFDDRSEAYQYYIDFIRQYNHF